MKFDKFDNFLSHSGVGECPLNYKCVIGSFYLYVNNVIGRTAWRQMYFDYGRQGLRKGGQFDTTKRPGILGYPEFFPLVFLSCKANAMV